MGKRGAPRKYQVDEDFFSLIDTEKKAYWLGFLTADGYVTDRHLRVRIAVKDKDHIAKLRDSFGSTAPIRMGRTEPGGHEYAEMIIGSMKIVKDLAGLGYGRNKSLTIRPCRQVPEDLLKHYWRGVFDGDGSISEHNRSDAAGTKWNFSLVGNIYIVSGFAAHIEKAVGISLPISEISKNLFCVGGIGIRKIQSVLRYLYEGASFYLERKFALTQACLARPPRKLIDYELYELEELEKMHNELGSWRLVADELDISTWSLYQILKKVRGV